MRNKLILFFVLFSFIGFSQADKKDKEGKKSKPAKERRGRIPDSLCYSQYSSAIIVGYNGSTKGYNLDVLNYLNKDTAVKSNLNYIGESNWVNGAEISFDKISLSFGISNTPPKNKAQKGDTKFKSFGFNFGGNKWILEANYRKYEGFYEKNTSTYDTNYKHTGNYYNLPGLNSSLYKVKFLYFSNHKRFAFKSCYSSSYRQIKSAFTWIITANAYYNTLHCDSSIIPRPEQRYYGDQAMLKGLDVFAFSVYGGASLNLVIWRHLLINTTAMLGPENQSRTYVYDGFQTRQLNYTLFSYDLRGAIGLNYKKFYTFVSFTGDITPFRSGQMEVKSTYYSINFTMGFRIHTKYPKFYQKIQNTKLYKML